MAPDNAIPQLLLQYLQGTLKPEDEAVLKAWAASSSGRAYLLEQLDSPDSITGLLKSYHPDNRLEVRNRVLAKINSGKSPALSTVHRLHFLRKVWFRYAAVLLLLAGTATYLYLNNKPHKETALKATIKKNDILPGGNRAILTLSNGSTIVLDSAADGVLVQQGNAKVIKQSAGSLAYNPVGTGNGEMLYNTISTPKGGQYQVVLSDGSRIWLNAASSVRFPTTFGNNRKIMITGEVYLEVEKDNKKPFLVSANGTDVEVLGTSFNINAYTDEPTVKTSLVTGSVKVSANGNTAILKPNEQCSLVNGKLLVVNDNNQEQTLAWKNGIFYFNKTNLADAMRQLVRWYDVEVMFEEGVPDIKLVGEIKRDLTLSQMLDGLGELGLKFRINGKQLIVYNDSVIK